jgi:hypothetical protein
MVVRLFLAGLLLVACGGEAGGEDLWSDLPSGGGSGSSVAGSAGQPAAGSSSAATAGQGGTQEPSGVTGGSAVGGSAGDVSAAGQGGTAASGSSPGGGTGGGSAAGGPGGVAGASGGAGGIPSADGGKTGAGGAASDPLEPKPLDGCPGYVKVLVPKGTCVWFHGTHSIQTESCSLSLPPEGRCSTASAASKDLVSIVSGDAVIERFDLEVGACPKSCN